MDKLHVALLTPPLKWGEGSVERNVLPLAQALLERGHRIDLLLTNQFRAERPLPAGIHLFTPATGKLRVSGEIWHIAHDGRPPAHGPAAITGSAANFLLEMLKLTRAPWPYRFIPRQYLRNRYIRRNWIWAYAIARYMDTARPGCILANERPAILGSLLALRLARAPSRVIPVIDETFWEGRDQPVKSFARLLSTTPRIVTLSRKGEDTTRTFLPHPTAERIVTIPNPVAPPTPSLRESMADCPHPWLEDDGPPVILTIGRLNKRGNFPSLLRAFARVMRERPCRLLIFGVGEERDRLRSMVRDLNLTDSVAMPGWTENPHSAMAHARVFVLSSRHEEFPTMLVEALACGCPVVSTDCAHGLSGILDGGRYGRLVPAGDAGQMALAILHTLEEETSADPEQRRRKRDERMQRARMFSPGEIAEQYLNLFSETASEENHGRGAASQ